jgi:hypothetical protein
LEDDASIDRPHYWHWRDLRLNRMEIFVKSYTKPTLVKLGTLALIKSNHTGPSTDGKKYAGNFK